MGQIITGTRALYEHMARRYGEHFTSAYNRKTFEKKVCLRDVPIHRQEKDRCRISFMVAQVEQWFEHQFADPSVLRRA